MALQYLLAPTFQFVNTAGKPLSGGAYMEVYVHGTRTKYFCASDFDGTLHPFRIPLDSLGSNIVLANDTGSYDVYAYNRYGTLMMSRYNVKPGAGGGIGGTITSTDGSIDIHPTEDGVDLSVNGLDPSCLKVSADPRTTDGKFHFDTLVQEGDQAYVDNEGAIRLIKGWYHFTANVQLAWNAGARNETHQVTLYTTLSNSVIDFDISHVHTETIELSGDVSIAQDGAELVIGVSGMPTGLEASVIGMDVHAITGKDGHDKYYAGTGITISNENYISADFNEVQEKLVAGQGVTIDGNVISAPSLVQVNSDWNATSGVAEILNKPDLDVFATKTEVNAGLAGKQNTIPDLAAIRSGAQAGASAVQPADLAAVATTGNYNDLNNRPNLSVYATTADMNTALATKQDVISDLSTIRSGAAAGATAVQPSDLATVATTGAYSDLSGKPDLSIYAQSADLAAVATSGDYDDLSNKPDLSAYATTQAMNTALAGKQDTISDLSTIRSGAEAGATAVQPGDLATVATTGSYDDLSDKPSIPAAQVNSDWNSVSGVSQILNKPSLAAVATTGDYDDLSNKPSIPAAQVNADWNSVSGVSEILNKPANLVQDANYVHTDENFTSAEKTKLSGIAAGAEVNVQADWTESDSGSDAYIANKPALATVATTGAYSDLSGTPTIPTATSDLTNDSGYITLSDVPAQAQADWTESDTSDPSYIQNKPNLATVATTGAYSDLSGTPTINNVPAVTSSDDAKVLKASYSGGVGSYSWQTEQGGGSTYTAGDAIDITNDEINVLYDSDTLELKSQEQTLTYALGTWDENYGRAYAQTTSDIRDILEGAPGWELTLHIPANTFYLNGTYGENIVLRISDDQYFNYSNYCLTPLAVTYDSVENKTWIDEQDIVLHTPDQDPDYWHISSDHSARYVAFGPISSSNLCTITSAAAGNNVTVTFTHAGGDPLLAVKNPLPASAIGDATKVLTVDNTGAPVWATAQAPISAGTGISITNNVVSVDNTVAMKSDLPTATSDLTNDSGFITLSDVPAQVNADWNSSSGASEILNKPTIPSGTQLVPAATSADADKVLTVNAQGTPEWATGGGSQVQSDWTEADSSAPSYIENKPVPKTLTAGTGISITENQSTITISSTVTAPVRDVTVDGTSVVSNGVAAITTPTVDQTYDASSTNAQSGVAVADAIGNLPTNLTSAQIQALKEALGVDETVLYTGLKSNGDDGAATYTLSELPTNFKIIKVYCCASDNTFPTATSGNCGMAYFEWDTTMYTPPNTFLPVIMNGGSGTSFTQYWTSANVSGIRTTTWTVQGSLNSATSNAKWFHIYKVVGIHRVASN